MSEYSKVSNDEIRRLWLGSFQRSFKDGIPLAKVEEKFLKIGLSKKQIQLLLREVGYVSDGSDSIPSLEVSGGATDKSEDEKPVLKSNGLLISVLGGLVILLGVFFYFNSNKVSDDLTGDLGNLTGRWFYKNVKEREIWSLQICYSDATKSGTYAMYYKYDNWGEHGSTGYKLRNQGQFTLIEGFDVYGDKAYVARDSQISSRPFVIRNLDGEWELAFDDMQFGMDCMHKYSNECK